MSKRTEVQAIYAEHGYLTKGLVLEQVRAKPEEYPASHAFIFHLDTAEAAENYYLERTGELIRSFQVKRRLATEEEIKVRQFHSLRVESGTAYRDIGEIVLDPFLTQLLLREATREWRQLWGRARHLEEFVKLVRGDLGDLAS